MNRLASTRIVSRRVSWLAAGAVSLGLMGGIVAAPPAAAASAALTQNCVSKPGFEWTVNCQSESTGVYSPDRWQWKSASVAVDTRLSGAGSANVTYFVDDMQYYWGLKWYKNKYRADTTATIKILNPNGSVYSQQTLRTSTEGRRASVSAAMRVPSGSFQVEVTSRTDGMFWGYKNGLHNGYPQTTYVPDSRVVTVHR